MWIFTVAMCKNDAVDKHLTFVINCLYKCSCFSVLISISSSIVCLIQGCVLMKYNTRHDQTVQYNPPCPGCKCKIWKSTRPETYIFSLHEVPILPSLETCYKYC